MVDLEFGDLLNKVGVAPSSVMVMRHRPTEVQLRRALPWLAAEQPEVYNTYQKTHGETVENSLARVAWLASFIGHVPGRALFVGLYKVAGYERISARAFQQMPHVGPLIELGCRGPKFERSPYWFDLTPTDLLSQYKGRLVIGWPGIERSWWRRAERNVFPVEAISEESLLVRRMPDWASLVVPWAQLGVFPSSWRAALAQWRGIYFIFDTASGKGYVGSASGSENLLGRWLGYSASGHGGNQLLRACEPQNLVFSIVQLVSPEMPSEDVVAIENGWKERLHTRAPFGLNSN